ncbi:MAG: cupin domain-containing protein [Sphingobacteriales bacterium]|jgi:quercetin dioxygenase-like cupin family protein|nr:cupin domain-containing protein [Sphingobacteriales bacterium]MBK6888495.1 cupin domain-containing protein [Sphingobacteriales bacterium]MBK7528985.1 cupin domain-containing protein [Sphingobacteriales bacterium]MBK8679021.1 cupin domain-containing protein [Sphingobacteriales bacterium]MBL0248722.1 cupin domain-containing protein [Sphingobacteriales bacterium]
MAKQGDQITNARTGQRMVFLKTSKETNGNLLEIDSFNPKTDMREPIHIHPKQESSAEVVSGKLHFLINGKEQIVGPGEKITIPAGAHHCFWNEENEEAHSIQRFSPALTIDEFFETFFALSRDGKLNEKGIPNFIHASMILLKHRNDIRVINPPWIIQIMTYLTLSPIGWLMGYRNNYQSVNEHNKSSR